MAINYTLPDHSMKDLRLGGQRRLLRSSDANHRTDVTKSTAITGLIGVARR